MCRTYASAAALLWTSRHEGFGLPPVEAAIRGVPVIAVETRAAVETLGGIATIVPPDSDAIAGAMVDPVVPTAQALEVLVGRFSPASVAQSLAHCYGKVLD
jgi:glycosyltransferase involved in cell wall biosynthesis